MPDSVDSKYTNATTVFAVDSSSSTCTSISAAALPVIFTRISLSVNMIVMSNSSCDALKDSCMITTGVSTGGGVVGEGVTVGSGLEIDSVAVAEGTVIEGAIVELSGISMPPEPLPGIGISTVAVGRELKVTKVIVFQKSLPKH